MATNDSYDITPEERSDFERACRNVRRMKFEVWQPARARPAPEPVQTRLDEQRVMKEILDYAPDFADAGASDEMSFCRPGVQRSVLRKLKKGHYCVNVALD